MDLKIWLPGRPATKKTGQRIVKCGGFPRILPSKAYEEYEEKCLVMLKKYKTHFVGKVRVCAIYVMPDKRAWPDLVGLMQATGDILERASIIDNDRDIVSWDGTRINEQTSKKDTGVLIYIEDVA